MTMRISGQNHYVELNERGFFRFSFPDITDGRSLMAQISREFQCDVFSKWHSLSPLKEDSASPVSYSGIYGLSDFPMHTDMANWKLPPRYLALWAETGSPDVSTPILDCREIFDVSERKVLARALVKPRRPVKGRLPIMRLIENSGETDYFFRWDAVFLKPASPAGEDGVNLISSKLERTRPNDLCLSRPGDGVIIDNWRMLHGRSSVREKDMKRRLRRAYFGSAQ